MAMMMFSVMIIIVIGVVITGMMHVLLIQLRLVKNWLRISTFLNQLLTPFTSKPIHIGVKKS